MNNISGTIASDDSSAGLSFEYDKILGSMDISMTANPNIRPEPELPAELVRRSISNLLRTTGLEEDDSNLSSSGTESFENTSGSSVASKGKWKVDINGDWQRYGSSESATSTGISSICSSVAADDRIAHTQKPESPSRKRMSDGSLKPPVVRLGSKPENIQESAQVSKPQHRTTEPHQETPKKRRGRPPKDQSASAQTTSLSSTTRLRRASMISKADVRPRSSIPSRLPADVYASQCIEAAYASRLNPYALHPGEHALLVDLLMSKEVTVYLNVRNAILRIWNQNPLCSVTPEEAAGCAKERRFFGLAEVAYKWLVRSGYINFGCVEIPRDAASFMKSRRSSKQRTVVVIGAGVSGLTTARQLEALFTQESAKWTDADERPPKVIVLEGRNRIGGRVYSKALRSQIEGSLPGDLRNTAEMGAMIVTGFEHGNPLDNVIRGQLGLRYHMMKDALTIYDCDGKPVDEHRDMLNTELYTDISDRAGEFRAAPQEFQTLKGDDELISRCRDPVPDGFANFQLEPLFNPLDKQSKPVIKRGRRRNAPPGTEKITGRSRIVEGSNATTQSAARAAKLMGWQLREGIAKNQSISLHRMASTSSHPTLGSVMDEAIEQYQDLIQLTPQDMRLLNWHHANLEYANAAPVSSLSLSGHDQDTGNEFEGAHSEIIGGYTQLPRGLMNLPTKLDVRFDRCVESIHYNQNPWESEYTTKVVCTDGEVIEADEVVMTAPLGVLKTDMIDFDPPLPSWKRGAINRMGFGLLNKVILLYDEPFWDDSRDMFGLLNEGEEPDSLDPLHYERQRGRFYLIWNASKICGRPMLVALMAGNAAHDVETTETTTLLAEINGRFRKVFPSITVPAPLEVIVTRWKRDPFTRGTYSYVAPETRSGDYDLMAQSVGNLHFAGEATCGTHPATVHGAFLSGLRVASEVMDAMAGPISLPTPLVGPAPIKPEVPVRYQIPVDAPNYSATNGTSLIAASEPTAAAAPFFKQEFDTTTLASIPAIGAGPAPKKFSGPPRQSVCSGDASFWAQASADHDDLNYEAAVFGAILSQIGDRPDKPLRAGVNPFLLYTKAKWDECKAHCDKTPSTAGRDAIRSTLGRWWKASSDEVKQPFIEQSQKAQESADKQRKEWAVKSKQWDIDARRIREEYVRDHPLPVGVDNKMMGSTIFGGVSKRKTNVSNCVVLDHS